MDSRESRCICCVNMRESVSVAMADGHSRKKKLHFIFAMLAFLNFCLFFIHFARSDYSRSILANAHCADVCNFRFRLPYIGPRTKAIFCFQSVMMWWSYRKTLDQHEIRLDDPPATYYSKLLAHLKLHGQRTITINARTIRNERNIFQ